MFFRRTTLLAVFGLAASIWPVAAGTGRAAAQADAPPDRVVFLHYDYMVKEGADGHSHAPDPRSIRIVVEAFRRHGVTLLVDPQHNVIPERQVVTMGPVDPACAGDDAVDIHDLRAAYFQPHDGHNWHYAVFAHRNTTPDWAHAAACPRDPLCGGRPDPDSGGVSEIGGSNFVVSLGPTIDEGRHVLLSFEASTFMHELGHNFGLLHGGADACVNDKPNYVSVMNYAYQLNGILVAAAPGSADLQTCDGDCDCGRGVYCDPGDEVAGIPPYCFRVDYSDRELPALDELSPSPGLGGLDESAGVSGPPDDADIVLYFAPGPAQLLAPSHGPIDWNGDGDAVDTHLTADVNNDGTFTLLTGFDDWAHVHAFLDTPDYRNGIVRQNPAVARCGR